jgi:hypothetical protein
MIKLLAEDTRGIKVGGASMRWPWRAQSDVRGVVADDEIEREIFKTLGTVLFWE